MPQVVVPALVQIGFSVATATAIYSATVAIASAYVWGKIAQRQLKQNPKQGPREVVVRDTTQPQVVVYGETFVGGLICYMNTVHPGVNQGHELHMAIVVAGHECQDITDIYLDDTLLDDGGALDWSANAVVSGTYDPDSRTDCEAVKVWKHLGTSTQTVDLELNAHYTTDWTSDYRLRGLAYLVFRFKLTTKSETLWAGGPPQSIRIKVKGKKVYDPRLDTSPGANPSTSTYIAWSENPVLCAADYMRSFMGVSSSRFDWDWIADQADICDAQVVVPPAASPSNYQKRYTCNGALSLGETHGRNIADILSSCLGRLAKVNGKWRVTAGAYETPSITLTDDDIIGPVVMSTSLSRAERFNTVRGVFGSDSSNKYREMEFKQVTSATYVTRDNGETISRSISLPMTTSDYMAQRIAIKMLNQGNQQTTVTVPVRWTGLKVAVGSGVNLTLSKFGWSSKVFRCVGWKMGGGDSPFELVLKEDNSTAWSDPAVGDYTTVTASGAVTLPDEDVAKDIPRVPYINHIPFAFGDFENISTDQFTFSGSAGYSTSIATDRYWLGQKSLKITPATGTGKSVTIQFGTYSAGFYNVLLPPYRRLLFVFAINCDNTDAQGSLQARIFYNGPGGTGNVYSSTLDLSTVTTVDAWARLALELDLTAYEATQCVFYVTWSNAGTTTVAPAFWLDGVELLDVTDFRNVTESNFPTHWVPPIGSTSGAVGLEGGARITAGAGAPEGVVTSSPGSMYHDNTNGTVYVKESGTGNTGWVLLSTIRAQNKVKDADTARTSGGTGTTLTDDEDLAGFTVDAATEYLLEAELRVTTASDVPDFKYTWQFSQTPQQASGFIVDEGGTGVTDGTAANITLTSTSTRNATGGADFVLRVSARILGHATTAGTLDFQWAQNNSSANATTLKAGSWMRLSPTT